MNSKEKYLVIINELRTKFLELADEYQLHPEEAPFAINGFYMTMIHYIRERFFIKEEGYDKKWLTFVKESRESLEKMGFKITKVSEVHK